jgi:NitT/TauT family transport system permease protein
MIKRRLKSILFSLIPLAIVLFIFEVLNTLKYIPEYLIPSPSSVLHVLWLDHADLIAAAVVTLESALAGLFLSFSLGTIIAFAMGVSPVLMAAIYPYAIFFQTVPIIAIAPLLVIWFGFGQPTAIASSFIVSFFPVLANTLLGIKSTDPLLNDLFRLYKASQFQKLTLLRIPWALPNIFTGLRIAAGLSMVGAIVGEFIGGGGLGSLIDSARTQQRLDLVFAAVLVSSLLGYLLLSIVNFLSWLTLRRWHISEKSGQRM